MPEKMFVLEWWEPGYGWERDAFDSLEEAIKAGDENESENYSVFEVRRVYKKGGEK